MMVRVVTVRSSPLRRVLLLGGYCSALSLYLDDQPDRRQSDRRLHGSRCLLLFFFTVVATSLAIRFFVLMLSHHDPPRGYRSPL